MTQPVHVSSVFISLRMSLARERDAAYHVLADLGSQPLLFEREVDDPEALRKMNLWVDSSDQLLLLYDGNGGQRPERLHGLTPIEYEFESEGLGRRT